MAGTSNGSSTYYLLLGTALARVIEYMGPGSEDAAKKLLLDYLDRRNIRWRCRDFDIGMNAWTPEAAEQFFWERHDSVVHDIDWPNHRATRAGPVFVPVSAIGARVLAYGPRTVLKAETIQLHWGDILGILQALGLAPAPCQPAAPTEAPTEVPTEASSETSSEASSEASSEEQTEPGETEPNDAKSDGRELLPPTGRSRKRMAIQEFVIRKYGSGFTGVTTAAIRQAAGQDKIYLSKGPLADRATFAYALGRKKVRKKARKKD
jgi:hypothetical protein